MKESVALLYSLKRQRGAAMVYLSAMAAALAMMVLFIYNSGHIANEKTRLQNTTDAAAYSVATLESRDLNFQAYTNRAMIANQVAIAQAVSLVSWLRFMDNVVEHVEWLTFWMPGFGSAIIEANEMLGKAVSVVEKVMGRFIKVEDEIELIISNAQFSMHFAMLTEIPFTLKEVVAANDPGVSAGLMATAATLTKIAKNYYGEITQYAPTKAKGKGSSDDRIRMDEFRDVTLRSRDKFTTTRTYQWGPKIPIFPSELKFERAGGAELLGSNNYYTWAAMDTLSTHGRHYRFLKGWTKWKEVIPLGWGAAQTGETVSLYGTRKTSGFGNTWKVNRSASFFASKDKSSIGSFSGLRPFNDLTKKGLLDKMPGAVVLLSKPKGGNKGIRTARDIGFAKAGSSIDIEQPGGMLNNQLHAVAKAEAYFSRPSDIWTRAGREYGNLYSPYWQPRLSGLSAGERVAAIALAGIE